MTEKSKKLLDKAIEDQLEVLKLLDAGSTEHQKAVEDLETLIKLDTNLYQVEMSAYNESERIEAEKAKNELAIQVEADKVKTDKRRSWLDNGVKIGCAVLASGGTVLAIYANQRGWLIDKAGLQLNPKIRI